MSWGILEKQQGRDKKSDVDVDVSSWRLQDEEEASLQSIESFFASHNKCGKQARVVTCRRSPSTDRLILAFSPLKARSQNCRSTKADPNPIQPNTLPTSSNTFTNHCSRCHAITNIVASSHSYDTAIRHTRATHTYTHSLPTCLQYRTQHPARRLH